MASWHATCRSARLSGPEHCPAAAAAGHSAAAGPISGNGVTGHRHRARPPAGLARRSRVTVAMMRFICSRIILFRRVRF
eukprot:691858-Hanusia_phi.AAC.7